MFPLEKKIRESSKLVAGLWIVSGLLFLVPAIANDGNRTNIGIGIMFLVFGVIALRGAFSPTDSPDGDDT